MKKILNICSAVIVIAVVLTSASSSGQTPILNDAEIASVAVTANQIDINFAKLAKDKSQNADIQKFAATMITDHQSVIDQAVALVKKLGVTPKDNDVSKKLNADAEKNKISLMRKSGTDFDRAYIDNEVSYHKAVIQTVQNVLIPQAQNAELKALLEKVVPILKTHLEHAEMVQKMFSK